MSASNVSKPSHAARIIVWAVVGLAVLGLVLVVTGLATGSAELRQVGPLLSVAAALAAVGYSWTLPLEGPMRRGRILVTIGAVALLALLIIGGLSLVLR